MIKKYSIIFFFIISCKSKSEIILFKDTQIVDVPFETTIGTFPWNNDFEGQRDSIFISEGLNEIHTIIKRLDKRESQNANVWVPRYAMILEYNNQKDTLYYDSEFKEGFLIQANTRLIDTIGSMRKYLYNRYKQFLDKEYYIVDDLMDN